MAEDQSRYWSPTRTYEFVLKIGTIDLTPDLYSITILTSVELPYQTFLLQLSLDPHDIILDEIYGQTPLKLTSKLYGTSPSIPMEQIEFELMYLSSDMDMEISDINPQTIQKDRKSVSISCVSRKAYITMNTLVNSVYKEQTLSSIITDLISKTGATLKQDTQEQNSEVIDQVLVPPSTLYKNLLYLDKTFGLFNGMSAIHCTYDNIVTIKNLSNKIKTTNQFILYQLPLGIDNTKIIESCNDGKKFYTTKNLQTKYKGNSVFAYLAPQMKHIVKPKDRLSYTINVNLDSFSQAYGLISKGNKIFFDSKALSSKTRTSVYKDHTGYELTQSHINAKYSKKISSISELNVQLGASLKILNLMDVGESIKVNTQIDSTVDFSGLYILRATHIHFIRDRDWSSSADLFLMRTNRTII